MPQLIFNIQPLLHGDTLFLSEIPSELSVRAVATGSLGSVVFDYDDAPSCKTENVSPYALEGDSPVGDYNPVNIGIGIHTLRPQLHLLLRPEEARPAAVILSALRCFLIKSNSYLRRAQLRT